LIEERLQAPFHLDAVGAEGVSKERDKGTVIKR
jgi:hypothetical protein